MNTVEIAVVLISLIIFFVCVPIIAFCACSNNERFKYHILSSNKNINDQFEMA